MAETREDVIEDIEQGIDNIVAIGKEVRKEIITTDRLFYVILVFVGFLLGLLVGLAL